MRLAKPRFDIGLLTNNPEPMLRFWQEEVGASFEGLLKVRRGIDQYRLNLRGSVLKINHVAEDLLSSPPSGYRELLLVREELSRPLKLVDPDGNKVTLVPAGYQEVSQVGITVCVRDLQTQRKFYTDALGLPEIAGSTQTGFRVGEGVIRVEQSDDAPIDSPFEGQGCRYITIQVFSVDSDHAHVIAHGGREALAPRTLGSTARISMVNDPAGNWVELSQRASIVGTLERR